MDIKNRPRIPVPDEDPYSVAGNGSGSSGSSGFASGNVAATREQLLLQSQQHAQRRSEKPPKLPPREKMYPHDIPKVNFFCLCNCATHMIQFKFFGNTETEWSGTRILTHL